MGGSNEFVECFCWGAVAEGGSGAVVEFVGDGVEVGLVAGDLGGQACERLNAPFGARCFLTSRERKGERCIILNAPFGARCFLT